MVEWDFFSFSFLERYGFSALNKALKTVLYSGGLPDFHSWIGLDSHLWAANNEN